MPLLNSLTVLPLPGGQRLSGDETDSRLSLALDGALLLRLRLERTDTEIRLAVEELPGGDAEHALWAASYWLFARDPDCQRLVWSLSWEPEESLAKGMLTGAAAAGTYVCERGRFWQLPWPWLPLAQPCYPQSMQLTDGKRHPLRRPKPRERSIGASMRDWGAGYPCVPWTSRGTWNVFIAGRTRPGWRSSGRKMEAWNNIASVCASSKRILMHWGSSAVSTMSPSPISRPTGRRRIASRRSTRPKTTTAGSTCWSARRPTGAAQGRLLAIGTGPLPVSRRPALAASGGGTARG